MNVIAEIRRRYHLDKETISSLSKTFNLSRPTIRKHINTVEEPVYQRQSQPCRVLGEFHAALDFWLEQEAHLPRKQRRTAHRLYECLQVDGYCGSYTAYVEETKRVSHLCLIRIDRNRYSVPAHWANAVISVRLTADCVRIVAEGQMIAEHARCFGRDQLICDPWHYLPILEKKARCHQAWCAVSDLGFACFH